MMRGLTLVEPMVPEPWVKGCGRDAPNAVPALRPMELNCGWLSKLKNSARNWRVFDSVIRVVFSTDMSKLNWPGPMRMPIPELPNRVAQVGHAAWVVRVTPFGIMAGAAQKALVLKKPGPPLYPPRRDSMPPGVVIVPTVAPGQSCARPKPDVVPVPLVP